MPELDILTNLFSTPGNAKSAYGKVIQAYTETFGNGTTQPSNPDPINPQPQQPEPVIEPDPEPVVEPDPQPVVSGGLTLESSINRWTGGYQVSFKIVNKSGSPVNTWTLKVKKSECSLDNTWNVNVKEDGGYYVITPVEWNSYIANGSSVEFGGLGSGTVIDNFSYTLE